MIKIDRSVFQEAMDLDVVGRHALLFDDDAAAAFVNSGDALVEWNSLSIDRYDVRNLLSGPPPPRGRRNPQRVHSPSVASSFDSELDHERYLDLPPESHEQESNAGAELAADAGSYHTVAFSYGNIDESADHKNHDAGVGNSGYCPPFPVPESLVHCLPPTEKAHQIIARTALFVGKHGGQSEIVLRVKQGDNPTFGFLMPDHHLHAYFRFLVDHQELLQPGIDGKSENEKKIDSECNQTDGVETGALSLLGSVYGYGEEEDGAVGNDQPESKGVPVKTLDASGATFGHDAEKTESSRSGDRKDEAIANRPSPSKEKVQVLKRNSFMSAFKSGGSNGVKKEGDSLGLSSVSLDKSLSSGTQNVSKVELLIVEPPSELKRLIDRIVEFILKNGRQFEAVLIEQDSKHGRFPFLLPSNQYHPYYLKVLQKAQESKLTFKSFNFEKDDSTLRRQDKKSTQLKESNLSLWSAGSDIPFDSDKKEKFRMVIGKSKKDGQDPPSKTNQPQFGVSVDAAAAAAILQAATRGIKNPSLGLLSSTLSNGEKHSHNSEGEQASTSGCHLSPHPENLFQKPMQKRDPGVPIPAGIAAAKPGHPEAADQADSSEAQMSKEQKLKAERLKRAKMFVAMLKTGAVPSKSDTPRSLSVEPQDTAVSGSGDVVGNLAGKEQDSSSIPLDVGTLDKKEKSEKKCSDDEYRERRSRRKYRSRSSRHEEENEDDEEEDHKQVRKKHRSRRSSHDEGKEEDMEDRDHRHARKKHRSHRSSLEEDQGEGEDRRDHEHSRKKHRSYHSSHDDDDEEEDYEEERHHKRSRRKHKSHRSTHHSREGHRHKDRHSSKKRESRHSRRHEKSSDDEHRHRSSSDKLKKRASHSEEELEEGEISSKILDPSRSLDAGQKASKDVSSSDQSARAPSEPSSATEVSNDLRAKIRAMLMATL